MYHRLRGLSTYRLSGLGKEDEHQPMLQEGHDTLYLLPNVACSRYMVSADTVYSCGTLYSM